MNAVGSTAERAAGARRGWVFYDAACSSCAALANRWRGPLERRGYGLVPLQAPGVGERLGVRPEDLLTQMWVLTVDGTVVGGADALVALARQMRWSWWAWPVLGISRLPWGMRLIRGAYRWVAAHRYAFGGACTVGASEGSRAISRDAEDPRDPRGRPQ